MLYNTCNIGRAEQKWNRLTDDAQNNINKPKIDFNSKNSMFKKTCSNTFESNAFNIFESIRRDKYDLQSKAHYSLFCQLGQYGWRH